MDNPMADEFFQWLKEKYPDVVLHEWQEQFAKEFYSHEQASGKTFLLRLLREFEVNA